MRETIRDLELQGGELPELMALGDELREALRGVIILLKRSPLQFDLGHVLLTIFTTALLATPDDIVEEFTFRAAELGIAVQQFVAAMPEPPSTPTPAALAPVPAPPPSAEPIIVHPPEVEEAQPSELATDTSSTFSEVRLKQIVEMKKSEMHVDRSIRRTLDHLLILKGVQPLMKSSLLRYERRRN